MRRSLAVVWSVLRQFVASAFAPDPPTAVAINEMLQRAEPAGEPDSDPGTK